MVRVVRPPLTSFFPAALGGEKAIVQQATIAELSPLPVPLSTPSPAQLLWPDTWEISLKSVF